MLGLPGQRRLDVAGKDDYLSQPYTLEQLQLALDRATVVVAAAANG